MLKGTSGPELINTIRAVSRGESYVSPGLAARLLCAQPIFQGLIRLRKHHISPLIIAHLGDVSERVFASSLQLAERFRTILGLNRRAATRV